MHQKRSVRYVYDLNTIDVLQSGNDFLIVFFGRSVDRNIADQKVLSDAYNIDSLDVAARAADSCGYFTEFSGKVMNSDA
jgi:hypothetical protein